MSDHDATTSKSEQQTHVLARTSPMGSYFVGRCLLCGKEGLRMAQANELCPNPQHVGQDEALVRAIEGPPPPPPAPDADGAVPLAECPPGLFLFNGHLGFKTEYGDDDVYCADSGERFWGGMSTKPARAKLMVQPIEAADLLARIAAESARDAAVGIVAKLPKTADGVPVIPGIDYVWDWHEGERKVVRWDIVPGVDSGMWATFDGSDRHMVSACYSTREAALDALAAPPAGAP